MDSDAALERSRGGGGIHPVRRIPSTVTLSNPPAHPFGGGVTDRDGVSQTRSPDLSLSGTKIARDSEEVQQDSEEEDATELD